MFSSLSLRLRATNGTGDGSSSHLAQHNGILNAAPRGRKPSGCFGAAEEDSLSHPAGRDTPDDSSLGEGAKGDTSSVIRLAGDRRMTPSPQGEGVGRRCKGALDGGAEKACPAGKDGI